MKLAGFLTIDLSEFTGGSNGLAEFPLERCPDKDSRVEFSVTANLIRTLTPEEIK